MATFQPVSRCSLRRLHPSIFQLQILTALASTAEQRNRGRGRGRGRTMTKTLGESSKATAYQSPTTTTTAVIDRIPILFKAGLDRCYFDAAARPYLSENMDYAFGSGDVKVEYSSNNNNNGPTTTTTTTTKTPLEHVMQIVGANSRWKPLSIVLDRMPRLGFKWGVDAVNWSIKQQQHEISIQLKKTEHDGDTHSTPSPSSLMDLEKAGLVLAGIRKSQGLEPNALTYSLILNALNKRAATTMKDTTASNHHQNQLVQFYTQYLLGYSSEVSSSSPSASTSSLPSPSIINEFHLKPVIANLARQGHVYHIITTILPLTAARCPHINYTSCSEIVPVLIDGILFAASSSNDGLVLKSLVSSSSSSGGVGLRNKVDVLEFVDMECSWYLQQEQHQQHGHIIHSLLLACYCHCLQQIQSCKPTITTTASPPPQNLNHHQLWISRINTLWNQISKKYGHPSWQDYAAMIPIVISQHSTTTFSTSSPLDTDYSQPPLSNLPRMHEFISEIRQRSSVSRNNKEYFTAHIYPLLIQQLIQNNHIQLAKELYFEATSSEPHRVEEKRSSSLSRKSIESCLNSFLKHYCTKKQDIVTNSAASSATDGVDDSHSDTSTQVALFLREMEVKCNGKVSSSILPDLVSRYYYLEETRRILRNRYGGGTMHGFDSFLFTGNPAHGQRLYELLKPRLLNQQQQRRQSITTTTPTSTTTTTPPPYAPDLDIPLEEPACCAVILSLLYLHETYGIPRYVRMAEELFAEMKRIPGLVSTLTYNVFVNHHRVVARLAAQGGGVGGAKGLRIDAEVAESEGKVDFLFQEMQQQQQQHQEQCLPNAITYDLMIDYHRKNPRTVLSLASLARSSSTATSTTTTHLPHHYPPPPPPPTPLPPQFYANLVRIFDEARLYSKIDETVSWMKEDGVEWDYSFHYALITSYLGRGLVQLAEDSLIMSSSATIGKKYDTSYLQELVEDAKMKFF